jgi:hypothetical protein
MLIRRWLTAAAAAALTMTAPTSSADAATIFPPSGSHAMTPQAPVWRFGDANVYGGVQVSYDGRSPYIINTLFRLRPHWVATCAGVHSMRESMIVTRKGSRAPIINDQHVAEPCDYTHHATSRGPLGAYTMKVHDTWTAFVPGGRGTATLDAVANFSITLV